MNLKMKSYKGGVLKGNWLFTTKLDGVCVILDCPKGTAMSKHGKPLYNFDGIFIHHPNMEGVFEVYRNNWETSVSLVRTQEGINKVRFIDLFPLNRVNEGMWLGQYENPTEELIMSHLKSQVFLGNEGLVLVPIVDGVINWEGKRVKVKPEITIDIRVTSIKAGTGKYAGMMGALETKYGKVGTGFTDADRVLLLDLPIGTIIEVGFMEWTKDNKMRHPRFKRVRFDKTEENLEGFKGEI